MTWPWRAATNISRNNLARPGVETATRVAARRHHDDIALDYRLQLRPRSARGRSTGFCAP